MNQTYKNLPTSLCSRTAGIVLAGGQSRRMGRDKRICTYQGQTLLSLAVALTQGMGQRFLSSSDLAVSLPGVTRIPDLISGLGPVGGLISVLPHVSLPWVLVLPCDMPKLTAETLALLFAWADQSCDAVLFHNGLFPCPLPLLCRTQSARRLTELALERDDYSIIRLIRTAGIVCLEQPVPEHILCSGEMDNVNTPQDYQALISPGT